MSMRNAILAAAIVMLTGCSTKPVAPDAAGSHSAATSMPTAQHSTSGNPIAIGSLTGKITFSNDTNDIWSIRADGSHLRQLTNAAAMEFDPTWSPDGSRIAYRHQSGDDGSTEIYVMDADGSRQQALTRN